MTYSRNIHFFQGKLERKAQYQSHRPNILAITISIWWRLWRSPLNLETLLNILHVAVVESSHLYHPRKYAVAAESFPPRPRMTRRLRMPYVLHKESELWAKHCIQGSPKFLERRPNGRVRLVNERLEEEACLAGAYPSAFRKVGERSV